MRFGNPSSDAIIVRDEMYRTMMERGSRRLADAVSIYRQGWRPKASNDDVMWLMPFEPGQRVRAAHEDRRGTPVDRDPCTGCGVRADQHRLHGCSSYRRGRAA